MPKPFFLKNHSSYCLLIESSLTDLANSPKDLKGDIPLANLKEALYSEGLFTENSAVLVSGQVEAGQFVVQEVIQPPLEPRAKTLSLFPGCFCSPL
jgi:hypothetical protein